MASQMDSLGPVFFEDRRLLKTGLPEGPSLDKLLSNWHFTWVELQETDSDEAYQNWQDHYEE